MTSTGPYYITSAGVATNLLQAAGALKTVNGVAPGATGNVTVGCTSGGFAAEAAAPSVSGGTISISVPAETIAVTCTGTGS